MSRTTGDFWVCYKGLPKATQRLARNAYAQFLQDPFHHSLHFKSLHQQRPIWSVRIGLYYRAVGIKPRADEIVWYWIGSHAEYDKLINSL
ncbi:hypothetical protein [Candidatus Binatus sp.]|uniref:ParE family toxin-like protein n=1 Tax=Candidatus Binatus sp. TaxID=2811406 RepID=UPI003C6F58B2